MDLSGRNVIVVGLGVSGVAAARLCLAKGAAVTATDSRPASELSDAIRHLPVTLCAGGHEGVAFERADLIVVSPGVPELAQLQSAQRSGVPVIGELELGARFIDAPMVAVGGTNGKSTVTTLLAQMFEQEIGRVFSGGNLGTPLSQAALQTWDLMVVEVSSFQLERAPTFHPRVALLLNVTDDHLDRYPDFSAYADAKGNAFLQQTSDDYAVIPANDPLCEKQARRGRGRILTFGAAGDYAHLGRCIVERTTGEHFSFEESRLHGEHNALNVAACVAAARAMGLGRASIERALKNYQPLPHRMAYVGEIGGVRFYDDSKGTNVGAAVSALNGLQEPRGVLIAGGRDKLGDYAPLAQALAKKGRAVIVLGEAANRIAAATRELLPTLHVTSLEQAVRVAFEQACPGDAVLLSPACSSFDMFKSYSERGEQFVAAVKRLETSGGRSA
jgi:UDP-N-acetylmuramoylalanine--D-glutamate ligase